MDISIIQALLVGLWTAVCWSGMLFGIYTNRCLVLSFGVGVILGDIPTALSVGAVAELAFMGFGVGAGGTVPPNPIGPGVVGTLMAITTPDVTPESALALSIPFAIAIQFLQTAIYTACAGNQESAKRALKNQQLGKYRFVCNITVILFAIGGFALGFMAAFAMPVLQNLIALIPAWLPKGLSVAGGMLPAIGFAMIMSVMLTKEFIPFALLGYICAAYLGVPTVGIALVGLVFALKHYFDVKKQEELAPVAAAAEEVSHDDWI